MSSFALLFQRPVTMAGLRACYNKGAVAAKANARIGQRSGRLAWRLLVSPLGRRLRQASPVARRFPEPTSQGPVVRTGRTL